MADVDDGVSRATVEHALDAAGTPVISISGEIDMSNVVSVETALAGSLHDHPARVVFDVSGLTFVDSSGIAVLLRAAERTDRLDLRSPSATVRRIIQATGLSDVLHIES